MLHEVALHCYNITQSYLAINTEPLLNSTTRETIKHTQHAIQLSRRYLLQDIFSRWDPFNGEISFSYNGGKDCQVLLIIYLGCLWELFMKSIQDSQYGVEYHRFPMERVPTVYIDQGAMFESAQEFLQESVDRYCLSLYESPKDKQVGMAQAFRNFLAVHPETEAIVIGVRHSDLFGETLRPVQETDENWPRFFRLQPLLHWNLSEIWSFLLYSGEEVCGLYELGFTSLGSVNNTLRNPYLRVPEPVVGATLAPSEQHHSDFEWEIAHNYRGDGQAHCSRVSHGDLQAIREHDASQFHPGWYLTKDEWERAGRLARRK